MANVQDRLGNNEENSAKKGSKYHFYRNLFMYSDRLQDRIEQQGKDMQDYLCELMNVYQSYHDFATQQYVLRGSKIRCRYGTKPALMDTISDHGVYMHGIPVMTCRDCRSWNIHNFGSCMCPESLYENRLPMPAERNARGEVAKRAPYNKFPHICVPVIDVVTGWQQEESSLKIDDGEDMGDALTDKAVLICRYGGFIQIIDIPVTNNELKKTGLEDNKLVELSEEYIQWLREAEGVILFPYRNMYDSSKAQEAKTITIGIGATFNKESKSWEIFKEVLKWKDEDFEFICNTLFDPEVTKQEIKDLQDKYAITDDQALDILLKTAESIYIPAVNEAVNLFRESNSENDIIYSQPQLEAIFDFAYNTGERGVIVYRDNPEYIIYYYFRKLQTEGVRAVEKYNTSKNCKRRINQMYLFFKEQYGYTDQYKGRMEELGFDEVYISTKEEK